MRSKTELKNLSLAELKEIAKENGLCAKIIKDYGGNDRVAFIRV